MEKRKREMKLNIPMCAACILLCLTLISIHMTGGLYAKYTATATGGDSARVVQFGEVTISETGDFGVDGSEQGLILPGVDLTKKAVVNLSASEVSTYVFVEYALSATGTAAWTPVDTNADGKPDRFTIKSEDIDLMSWSPASDWSYVTQTVKKDDRITYIFYQELEPGATLTETNLIGNNGKISVSEEISKEEIAALTGIYIDLRASVVQAGDFADASAAWTSIASKGGI